MRAENANGEDVRIELVEIRHITACDGQRMIFTVGVGTDITHAAEVDDQFTSRVSLLRGTPVPRDPART